MYLTDLSRRNFGELLKISNLVSSYYFTWEDPSFRFRLNFLLRRHNEPEISYSALLEELLRNNYTALFRSKEKGKVYY